MTEHLKYHVTIKWNGKRVFLGVMSAAMTFDMLTRVGVSQFSGKAVLDAQRSLPSLNTLIAMAQGDKISFSVVDETGSMLAVVHRIADDFFSYLQPWQLDMLITMGGNDG